MGAQLRLDRGTGRKNDDTILLQSQQGEHHPVTKQYQLICKNQPGTSILLRREPLFLERSRRHPWSGKSSQLLYKNLSSYQEEGRIQLTEESLGGASFFGWHVRGEQTWPPKSAPCENSPLLVKYRYKQEPQTYQRLVVPMPILQEILLDWEGLGAG